MDNQKLVNNLVQKLNLTDFEIDLVLNHFIARLAENLNKGEIVSIDNFADFIPDTIKSQRILDKDSNREIFIPESKTIKCNFNFNFNIDEIKEIILRKRSSAFEEKLIEINEQEIIPTTIEEKKKIIIPENLQFTVPSIVEGNIQEIPLEEKELKEPKDEDLSQIFEKIDAHESDNLITTELIEPVADLTIKNDENQNLIDGFTSRIDHFETKLDDFSLDEKLHESLEDTLQKTDEKQSFLQKGTSFVENKIDSIKSKIEEKVHAVKEKFEFNKEENTHLVEHEIHEEIKEEPPQVLKETNKVVEEQPKQSEEIISLTEPVTPIFDEIEQKIETKEEELKSILKTDVNANIEEVKEDVNSLVDDKSTTLDNMDVIDLDEDTSFLEKEKFQAEDQGLNHYSEFEEKAELFEDFLKNIDRLDEPSIDKVSDFDQVKKTTETIEESLEKSTNLEGKEISLPEIIPAQNIQLKEIDKSQQELSKETTKVENIKIEEQLSKLINDGIDDRDVIDLPLENQINDDISLSNEILETFSSNSENFDKFVDKKNIKEVDSEIISDASKETIILENKTQESKMPEMNFKGEQGKVIIGEEIKPPVTDQSQKDKRPPVINNKPPAKEKTSAALWFVLVILLMILILVGGYYFLFNKPSKSSGQNTELLPTSAKKNKDIPPVIIQDEPTASNYDTTQIKKPDNSILLSPKDTKTKQKKSILEQDQVKNKKSKTIILDESFANDIKPKKKQEVTTKAPEVVKIEPTQIQEKTETKEPVKTFKTKRTYKKPVYKSRFVTDGPVAIVVSSLSNQGTAKSLVSRIKSMGYRCYIQETEIDGNTWYRVKVGNYLTEENAEKDYHNLRTKLKTNAYIESY